MGARKWVISGFLAAVLLVVGLGVYAARAKENREQSNLDAAVARAEALGLPICADDLRTNPIPDEDNAWFELKKIQDLFYAEQSNWPDLAALRDEKDLSRFTALAPEALGYWKPAFELADIAADKSGYRPLRQWERGVAMLFSDLAMDKALTKALLLQSRYDLLLGDSEGSLAAIRTASAICQHLREERSIIGSMTQAAIEALIASELVYQAGIAESVDHVRALTEVFEDLFPPIDVKTAYRDEVVLFVESVRMVNRRNEYGNELRKEILESGDSGIDAGFFGSKLASRDAVKFEAMAIDAACDYYESITDDLNGHARNGVAFMEMFDKPRAWESDGFPTGFSDIYYMLGVSEPPFGALAKRPLRAQMYAMALQIVIGGFNVKESLPWPIPEITGARLSYVEHEGGFSITATAPDLDPITLKFDRPK